MPATLNISMALTDAFGGFGGISRFNRDFLAALDASSMVTRVRVFPRIISEKIEDVIPEAIVYHRKAARGKIAFVKEMLTQDWHGDAIDIVVCGHVNLLPAAWLLSRLQRARLALIIHGVEAWRPHDQAIVRRLARRIDVFVAVSHYTARRFMAWSQVTQEQGFVLPNCVDLERFRPEPKDRELADRHGLATNKVIMTLGRLASGERYKGIDEVFDVLPKLAARLPEIRYLIVGDGDDRGRLEERARTLGIANRVVFAGRIGEAEKNRYYSLADAFVMPSSGEGFGIALIEAAACGVPTIGSAADGSREALLDGSIGKIVSPNDPEALIAAIVGSVSAIAPHCRPSAVETFSVQNFRARVDRWLRAQTTARSPAMTADVGSPDALPVVPLADSEIGRGALSEAPR
jgi:phosphatidyl-myo-inositol dimannoside synthase